MSPFVALAVAFLIMLLLVGLVALIAVKLGLLRPLERAPVPGKGEESAAYRKREHVLSPAERAFFGALREAVPLAMPGLAVIVFPSVRLAEVLAVDAPKGADRSAWQRAFNRISSKQVDFVVCEASTTRPLLVIELDDASHDAQSRRQRDDLVDRACASAGLPILHVAAAGSYNVASLATQIAQQKPKA